jgi:hypothetical protein
METEILRNFCFFCCHRLKILNMLRNQASNNKRSFIAAIFKLSRHKLFPSSLTSYARKKWSDHMKMNERSINFYRDRNDWSDRNDHLETRFKLAQLLDGWPSAT